jgi:hypothetical protein
MLSRVVKECGFLLPELLKLERVWRHSAGALVDKLRRMQYQLAISHPLHQNEAQLLWENRRHLTGHNRFLRQLVKVADVSSRSSLNELLDLLQADRTVSCQSLGCEPSCSKSLLPEDALELLCAGKVSRACKNAEVREILKKA